VNAGVSVKQIEEAVSPDITGIKNIHFRNTLKALSYLNPPIISHEEALKQLRHNMS